MAKHHHHGKEHNPPHRGFTTLLGMSMHMHHMGEDFFSLPFSFTFHLCIMLIEALYINHRYRYRYLPADENCQGMTCFLLQRHLGVLPTLTSDTFGILRTPTASNFWRHFGVLPILTPIQQSPTLLHTPSTLTP